MYQRHQTHLVEFSGRTAVEVIANRPSVGHFMSTTCHRRREVYASASLPTPTLLHAANAGVTNRTCYEGAVDVDRHRVRRGLPGVARRSAAPLGLSSSKSNLPPDRLDSVRQPPPACAARQAPGNLRHPRSDATNAKPRNIRGGKNLGQTRAGGQLAPLSIPIRPDPQAAMKAACEAAAIWLMPRTCRHPFGYGRKW